MTTPHKQPLLTIEDLAVSFDTARGGRALAVNGVSLTVHPAQTLAVVGESGSGKSVTAMSVLRLLQTPPARYDRGRIILDTPQGHADVLRMPERDLRTIRGGVAAMIFQEPMTSLNPVYTIGDQIIEAILLHQAVNSREARDLAAKALADVGIANPAQRLRAYPHEFSGGMRQRVMIAMALACKPRLLLADEPTTALDATIQAQVLALLRDLQRRTALGIMLITHNLALVAQHADAACVMYAGRVVEYAAVHDLFARPLHPYTRGLLRCIPRMRERVRRLVSVSEVIDDPKQFEQLPGADKGIRPWWPAHKPPSDLRPAAGPAGDSILHEIEPSHWVACWRTEPLESIKARTPTIPTAAQNL